MKVIKNEDINTALINEKRIYLSGNLKEVNKIEHIQTDGYEIGISNYDKFTCERAHYHSYNFEFNYVLEGVVKVYIFSEKKEYILKKGDLFLIEPNMIYISKAIANTRVLFTKNPGGNDKILTPEYEENIKDWMENW